MVSLLVDDGFELLHREVATLHGSDGLEGLTALLASWSCQQCVDGVAYDGCDGAAPAVGFDLELSALVRRDENLKTFCEHAHSMSIAPEPRPAIVRGMHRNLPSGTVTFLFTDVEGSTKLLHELGAEAYADALAEHRRVVRDACRAEGGVEVDTQGDAFFFAFPTAPGAVVAAVALTEALATGAIRVRVGLHTGTPLVTEEGYVGADVHRAARIAASGSGGQVLVSTTTATLLDFDLRDLGEHRFKDLAAAERVYQLGDGEFGPLASLYRTNLPVPATPFLGRERELAAVVELLGRAEVRLVTLTGPGGTGKTRLALQAAAEASERFPDGVYWVPLAHLRDPALVLEQATRALGSSEELQTVVADRHILLLLDNLEHLLGAARDLSGLLAACRNLHLLVTSRELLRLEGEHAYRVPTLSPRDGTTLFLARARAVESAIADDGRVDELCQRLDNLPLAIELAAARTRHLTVDQLFARVSERLDLLKGGRDADPRQATLRATIEWSHDLLSSDERRLFSGLAVFVGGCTLEAAEAVCDADLDDLSSLLDKSLVRRTGERYWMLETIREFAAERLDDRADGESLRGRHAALLLRLADTLGFTVESIERGFPQRHDVALAELANVRGALEWATHADPEQGLRLALALENFWVSSGPHDALRWFDRLADAVVDPSPELRAMTFRFRGNLLATTGQTERGIAEYEASLDTYRESGDRRGMAVALHRLGANVYLSDAPRGRRLFEEGLALARDTGFRICEAMLGGSLASADYREGNVEGGLEGLRRTAELAREAGFAWWEANTLAALATYSAELDRVSDAEDYALEWLEVARRMGDRRHAIQALANLSVLAIRRRDPVRGGILWGAIEAEDARGPLGTRPRMLDWEKERDRFAAIVFADPSPALVGACERGRQLSLEEAMDEVLASID